MKKIIMFIFLGGLGIFVITIILIGSLLWHRTNEESEENENEISNMVPPDFNLIVVGWDGVQYDHFWECYNAEIAGCEDGLPNIKALSDDAIYDLTISNGATATKPGWAQILTGYAYKITGVFSNSVYRPIAEGYTIFEKLEDFFGSESIATMFVAGKLDHVGSVCKGEVNVDGEIESLGQPWCLTKTSVDLFENGLGANNVVGATALEALETYADQPFFAFFHFHSPDQEGHKYGENSSEYTRGLVDDDRWLGEIVDKLEELGIAEKTYIYVVTDHGFGEDLTNHFNSPYGFFATNDARIIRGGDRMDIGATLLWVYGLDGEESGAPALSGYPLQEPDPRSCLTEGEAYLDIEDYPFCCEGLEPTNLDLSLGSHPAMAATGRVGDGSGFCQK
jgi:hypothetical protein